MATPSASPAGDSSCGAAVESSRRPLRRAGWMGAVWVSAAILGSVVFRVQQHFAPLLLLPLVAGAVLGLAAWKLAGAIEISPGKWIVPVLLAAALSMAVSQHLSAWRHYRAALEQSRRNHPELALLEAGLGELPNVSLGDYLRLEARQGRQIGALRLSSGWTWASWCFDALVALLAAVAAYYVACTAQRSPSASPSA